ncbi:two-component system, OmpR family, sensor kinase [Micromonospora haikouensis]|uniref:histidine kinase n=1 Tax=Micromonospora haikouensis TaxID=686309 RepID=A0A1C4YF15_9ACTN|nr:HAMP domain-containing sensor histidine kinase [Micromonospora haikouensis]SCF19246.1 two-component system, OmpR family, sensor kinase [Micromonospora haikouensis]
MSRRPVRPWAHWTLRSRLVLLVGILATLALLGANAAGLVLLRGYLLQRVDQQLTGQARPFADAPRTAAGSSTGDDAPAGPRNPGRLARLGPDQLVVHYLADGTRDAERSSTPTAGAPDPGPLAEVAARARDGRPYTVDGDGDGWRLLAVSAGDGGEVVVLGASLAEAERTVDRLMVIDVAVTGSVLVVLGLLAAFVVRLGLRPLTRMERVVAGITGGDLARRLDDTDPHTEPGRLGAAVNLMLDRIGTEMTARAAADRRLRQFVADASHELRTPLTSIRGFAELYRRGGAPPGPRLAEAMGRIEAEAARMGVLVEDLLLLARLDRHRTPVLRPVDLLEVAADTIRDAHARAPGRRIRLTTLAEDDETFEPPTVLGDEHRLRQVAANLLGNAMQHTGPGARVTVRIGRVAASVVDSPLPALRGGALVRSGPAPARPTGALAVLEVHDDGPGIPVEHATRVFERLYRADPSRGRGDGGGSGLGLSIAASIAYAHGGWIELDTAPGAGTAFRVLLPAAGSPAQGEGPTPPARDAPAGQHDPGSRPAPIPSQL